MIERSLTEYGGKEELYKLVYKKAEEDFRNKIEILTTFHEILIDRVVDAYVSSIVVTEDVNVKKSKEVQDKLQKWLSLSFSELHSSSSEAFRQRRFYTQVAEIIKNRVTDEAQRRAIFSDIVDVIKKDKVKIESEQDESKD